jgi:ribulose-phosphate 3-epimerase
MAEQGTTLTQAIPVPLAAGGAPQKVLIAPSILSADILNLQADLDAISTADFVHVDVMDGRFVPNLTFGPNVVRAVKKASAVPADVHLMIERPEDTLALYLDAGADWLTFHWEAATHAHRMVCQIHAAGARAGVSLNPGTPVEVLRDLLPELDLVLIMSVDPGFGGQAYIEGMTGKSARLAALIQETGSHALIEVDGGVTAQNAGAIVAAGARALVAGSAVYNQADRAAAIAALRAAGASRLGAC